MSAIAWWVIPIVATIGAIVYVTWRGRPRPPEDTHEAMEARERFRQAIENGNGPGRKPRTAGRAARTKDATDGPDDGAQPGA